MTLHDIVIVSDLHLGRGKNPETGRYARLEAFFYDDDFDGFCRWLCAEATARNTDVKLVLNGDTFDLLRIEPERPAPGATLTERRYGPLLDAPRAARLIAEIVAGHPGFVTGIARVLAAGHHVVLIPGNHDPELQWAPVQDVVRRALLARVRELNGDAAAERAAQRLVFEDWFHHEPDRIWIEHGSQYDAENSFQYNLRGNVADDAEAAAQLERDLPVGTFFQRYLYNSFGAITFIVPSSRANLRYVKWLILNKPRTLARTLWNQMPFFLQVMRRVARAPGGSDRLAAAHRARLAELGELATAVDKLKSVRGSSAVVTRGVLLQFGKVLAFAVLVTLMTVTLWFTGFYAIGKLDSGFTLKAVLFLALNLLFFMMTVAGVGWTLLRSPQAPPGKPPLRAARRIAELAHVPIVVFGHTHDEEVARLPNGAEAGWYFNTGTWIAVFTYDELIPRERVQYTFLRVRDREGALLHWSPGRGEAVPVILLDDEAGPRPAADVPPA